MRFLIVIACLTFSTLTSGAGNKETVQVIEHPNKKEYSYGLPGTDKHKYGYEINENSKYFHHTTTADDGVRLGCYGFILEGKKYSTQYVADVRGYRPVYTYEPITVYPKVGEERKASFVGDFNEAEQQSQNIRYFFPDGCKGAAPTSGTQPQKPFVQVKDPEPIRPITRPPSTPAPTPPTTKRPTPTTKPPTQPPKVFLPPKVPNQIVDPPKPAKSVIKPPPVEPVTSTSTIVENNVCDANCCDSNKPMLVLPVPLKSGAAKSGSCGAFGKLKIPIEGIDIKSLELLAKGGDSKELVKSILKNIQ